MPPYRPARERFEDFVFPDPNSGCFIWAGATDRGGYGRFTARRVGGPWRPVLAHRYAYEMAKGPIPEGMNLLHKCDTPACVNPDHLYPGTFLQNSHDMARRDRGITGSLPFGVHPQPKGGGFSSRVRISGASHYLGTYRTAEEASAVAVAFKRKIRAEKEITMEGRGPNAVPVPLSLKKGSVPAPPKSMPEPAKDGFNSLKIGR